jgi:hypothetical protein
MGKSSDSHDSPLKKHFIGKIMIETHPRLSKVQAAEAATLFWPGDSVLARANI